MALTLLKEKSFVLLMSIIEIGGFGTKKEVLDNINENMYLNFSQLDLEVKHNRNELHWRNDLAFVRKRLVTDGYINDEETNNWRITSNGREYLLSLCYQIINENISELKKISSYAVDRAKLYIHNMDINEVEADYNRLASVLSETDREMLIKIRVGQGIFKRRLLETTNKCKVCGLQIQALLIGSHIKPWKDSDNYERLDVNNGFLLCPIHDSLFDKGYISFDESGKILISNLISENELNLLNVNSEISIELEEKNKKYLVWHRQNIFKD